MRQLATKAQTTVPWVRGFKITDNQSPQPQDRVFFNFNFYDNLNKAVNQRLNAPITNVMVYRYQLGFEKTLFDGKASIGLRDSINTLSSNSRVPGLGGTSSAPGDLNLFMKYVLWQDWKPADPPSTSRGYTTTAWNNRGRGGLISAGLSINTPTGPGSFAGAKFSRSLRNTQLQPFVGYYWSRGDFYLQGFEAIDVPLDSRDVTMLFNDVGMGYFLYRNPRSDGLLTAIAPAFEVHVNIPLTHRDVFNVRDIAGSADVVDLTYGTNFQFGRRSLLSLGIVTPVTGPRPFNFEAVALFNVYYGGSRRSPRSTPPILGR